MVTGQRAGNSQPEFGTNHHTTRRQSEEIREEAEVLFTRTFGELPLPRYGRLKVLDMGCGLGFLSCVCAGFYSNSKVTGFDTFEHASLKNSSLAKAEDNAKILGFSRKIRFEKGDFFSSDYGKGKFDLFVSNLVFENFGRKRFVAYERLAKWMNPRSFAVLGELFFDYKTDSRRLEGLFNNVKEMALSSIEKRYKVLVLSRPRRQLRSS